MLFEIQVRPGRNSQAFQPYTETVDAATSSDAVARVQRANPGCQVICTKSYYKSPKGESAGGSGSSAGGLIGLIGLGAFAFVLVSYTPWVLMLLGGMGATWIGEKITGQSLEEYNERSDDKGHRKIAIVLALAIITGGFGFVQGSNLQREWSVPESSRTAK
ncbi:hypothetical protein SCBWM1_gp61 [Synechococcus phage S-CBWM1]|uniref:Uncharacterized protein n=1 Tax=Synechococcus phage S-CBWM1 TaxID=2053653 RepID=A0A3G1L3I7_9CAUD|nr:hypothetical protein HOU61_gp136 [Synechococcus phage S-CBWM1]ATW62745.1 hypothetical protein SCBWM1_gp61 [Synechococcus phage S-CBWM1]